MKISPIVWMPLEECVPQKFVGSAKALEKKISTARMKNYYPVLNVVTVVCNP